MTSRSRRHPHRRPVLALIGALLAATIALASGANAAITPLTPTAPIVRTEAATAIARTTATLTGTVNPGGLAATYFFQYGPTAAYASQTRLGNLAAGSAPVGINAAVAGLAAGAIYHFRIVGINALGTTLGADASFTTLPPRAPAPKPPAVRTGVAGSVTAQSARLTGTVNPNAQPTTYFFQYGATVAYGAQTAPAALGGGSVPQAVSGAIAGLAPVVRYHYRLVAVNATGTTVGADAAFTTAPVPLALAIRTPRSPVAYGAPLDVSGTITGSAAPGRTVTLQENPYPFTGPFRNIGNPQRASAAGSFAFNLTQLLTTTQFRALSAGGGLSAISPTATVGVGPEVTMQVTVTRTRTRAYRFAFSGLVKPAQGGARVSLQRLVAGRWMRVALTSAQPSATGTSSYARTVRRRHGGYFRVHVSPVSAGLVPRASSPQLVHARPTP